MKILKIDRTKQGVQITVEHNKNYLISQDVTDNHQWQAVAKQLATENNIYYQVSEIRAFKNEAQITYAKSLDN